MCLPWPIVPFQPGMLILTLNMNILKNKTLWAGLLFSSMLAACFLKTTSALPAEGTKAGVSAPASDPRALAIADEVMQAMGGQKAWDNTRYISWKFFGRRNLLWDKKAGICRIEWLNKPWKILVNLNDGTGKVSLNGI